MAKQNHNSSKSDNKPEKRGGILGFFDSIKAFFTKLFDKIKEKLEFDKRKDEGKFTSTYSQSIEGQKQAHAKEIDDAFGFQTWEEHVRNQEVFPGFQDMQISNGGLLTIPPKTALIWRNDTIEESAVRYNICMDRRFQGRPDPLATHNGQAFNEIAGIMRQAEARGDTETKMFVLGTTFIQARQDAEGFHFAISNGKQSHEFTCQDKWDISSAMMKEYTALNAQGNAAIFIDPTNNTRFAALRTSDHSFDAYTIKPVIAYSKDTKVPMENVTQITGPTHLSLDENARLSLQEVQVLAPKQGTEVSDANLRDVAAAAVRNAGKEGMATTYIVGDKVLWASVEDGKTTVHITPITPPSKDPRFHMQLPVTEKMFRQDNGNLKTSELFKAVKHEISTLDGRLQAHAALEAQAREIKLVQELAAFAKTNPHPSLTELPALADASVAGIGQKQPNGYDANVVVLKATDHTIVLKGETYTAENGDTHSDVRIECDGRLLYYNGPANDTLQPEFTSKEEAFRSIAERVGEQELTRTRLEIPDDYRAKIEALEAAETAHDDAETPASETMDEHENDI